MRRTVRLLAVIGMIVLLATGVAFAQAARPAPLQQPGVGAVPDYYIVVLKDNVGRDPAEVASEQARQHGLAVSHVYRNALKGYAARIPAARLAALRDDARVEFISEDREVRATAQTMPTGTDRVEADRSSTSAGDGGGAVDADIAVIDSGIYKHPDLNVAGGYNCTNTKKSSAWSDGHGHGTHVAGSAGAKDDGNGVVGVAPGARLWAAKVLGNNGTGYTSWVICGIDWATGKNTDSDPANNIEVANMSLGGSGSDDGNCGNTNSDAKHRAICRSVGAGVTYTIAAGNESGDFSRWTPAAYDEVLTVTSVADFDGGPGGLYTGSACVSDTDDTARNTSDSTTPGSSDAEHTIAAPGACIYSTSKSGGYTTMSGTSMASPHVAGAAALCIASGKCTSPTGGPPAPADVMNKLLSDARTKSDPLATSYYGFTDDPNRPNLSGRYYGYLVHAGDY